MTEKPQMTLERARDVLGADIRSDGGLFCLGRYLGWTPGQLTATLDAAFTADELEAIAVWMRATTQEIVKENGTLPPAGNTP